MALAWKGRKGRSDGTQGHRGSSQRYTRCSSRRSSVRAETKAEVDEVTCWLTGYDAAGLKDQIARETDYRTFFAEAPRLHPNAAQIKGTICGYRIEDIEDPLEQKARFLDKLVDELAKGRPMEKIEKAGLSLAPLPNKMKSPASGAGGALRVVTCRAEISSKVGSDMVAVVMQVCDELWPPLR